MPYIFLFKGLSHGLKGVHRTLAFRWFDSPTINKNRAAPQGAALFLVRERGLVADVSLGGHIVRCRSRRAGIEQVSTGHLHLDGSSPPRSIKIGPPRKGQPYFWCERGDSNPHGITTRTSNVLVYHSNTLANMLKYYNLPIRFCQYFFCKKRIPKGYPLFFILALDKKV